ncbi:hypothetical protein DNTS_004297 [Danionella cerebrum]|uniref:Uncharacterized protein n=1 Tax=Danionella cerebrum TaxID=2873325 RepID=A0A553N1S8_9TELE|nr:hypothetical protein DNTS_004297 [Danionella translucida]
MNADNQEPDLLALKFLHFNPDQAEVCTETVNNCTAALAPPLPAAPQSSSSVATSQTPLPAYLSSILTKPRGALLQGPATMEQMRTELRELRDELDTLKTQQKKEIKLLMNELDEEKKMRLSLQIEVERLKKLMSKMK